MRAVPDLERLFHDAQGPGLSEHLSVLTKPEIMTALRFTEPERRALTATVGTLRERLLASSNGDQRVESYRDARGKLHDGMSEASYARVMAFVEEEAARALLAQP